MSAAKVGIKSCRGTRECVSFVHVALYVATQLELFTYADTNVTWVVSDSLASYLFLYFLF